VVNHKYFYINPYQDGNQRWQLKLGVGVNSGVGTLFTKVGVKLEFDFMHFVNSNSTPFDVVACPVKMTKIENVTSILEAIASE